MAKHNNKHSRNNSNANRNKTHHTHHGKKKHTAVIFDEKQRDDYLKGMFGAKKRRKQFHKNKLLQEQKVMKKEEKAQNKAHRKQQLRKAKQLLNQLKQNQGKKEQLNNLQEKEVQVKKEGNLVIETKFY